MKNKKGSTLFVMLSLAMLFFVIGMALAKPIGEIIDDGTNNAQLNCTSPSITQQDKAVCTQLDIMQPLLVGTIFGLAGLIIGRTLI